MTIDNETIINAAMAECFYEIRPREWSCSEDELITFARKIAEMQIEIDAGICDKWVSVNHVYTNGAIRCAEDIRSQK